MYGTDPRAGEHGHGGIGDHRHVKGDSVALAGAQRLQAVGEAANPRVQFAVGDLQIAVRVITLPDDGDLVGLLRQVAINAVIAGVQSAVVEPAYPQVIFGQRDVLDLGIGLHPVQSLPFFCPEGFVVLDRASVFFLVTRFIDPGSAGPGGVDFSIMAHA